MAGASFNLDPRKLIYFATIVEHRSFKRAAKSLGLSQPALSMSMDKLEAELDIKVLNRGPKGAVPTPEGDVLYSHACAIRSELLMARHDLTIHHIEKSDELRIGSLPSLSVSIIPTSLARWREGYHDKGLHVVEGAQIELLTGLHHHQFDIVFGYTDCYDLEAGLNHRVLFRDKLCIVARPGHPLAKSQRLKWQDVVQFPWISPTSRRPHAVLESALKSSDADLPTQLTFCGSTAVQKSLISEGNLLTMLPTHSLRAELSNGQLVSLPVAEPGLERNIAAFWRHDFTLEDAGSALLDHVAEIGHIFCDGAVSTATC